MIKSILLSCLFLFAAFSQAQSSQLYTGQPDPVGAALSAQTAAVASSVQRLFFTVGTGGVTANMIVGYDASGNAIAATSPTGNGGIASATGSCWWNSRNPTIWNS